MKRPFLKIIDWGMQLEDWEEHIPERMPEALDEIQKMARKTLFIF